MGTGEELGRHSAGGGAGGGHCYCTWGFSRCRCRCWFLALLPLASGAGVRVSASQRQVPPGNYLAGLADIDAVAPGCVQQADGLGIFMPLLSFSASFFQLNRSINRVQCSFRYSLTGQDCLLRLRLSRCCEPVRE